jgi:enamine deaminase RidA (YjgF/YER057c/UK114 family)
MIEEKLILFGVKLSDAPAPAGSYIPVAITGNLAFVSGQIPVELGVVPMRIQFSGKVGKDISVEEGQKAARLCTINALTHLKMALGSLDNIKQFIKVSGFVNSDSTFTDHAKVINGASDFIIQLFGEKGKHARSAVGMSSLPLNSAVEVEFIIEKEQ